MSDRPDAGPSASLSIAQEERLQLAGYLSSALSLLGTLYVLAHFGYRHCCRPKRLPQQLPFQFQRRPQRSRVDFMDKLVLVLALFDLITIAARAVGRGVVHDRALCRAQAAVIQAANLASCIWICCMAFNLYRWIAGGESDATRQRRFPLFLATAVVPGAGFVVFHLMSRLLHWWYIRRSVSNGCCADAANKYGDATFYCWLDQIRYMFLNFYLFYLLMIVFNLVLLGLIHLNMKQRVARYGRRRADTLASSLALRKRLFFLSSWVDVCALRHDTVEADTSSMLIRRKLLLYIVIFVVHRTPMMIYRSKFPLSLTAQKRRR
jgi:hypothetical protein